MQDVVGQVAMWTLVVSFAWAAVAKAVQGQNWRAALATYGFSGGVQKLVAPGVPLAEGAVVALLLSGAVRPAASFALALLALFSLAIFSAHQRHGERLPCGCFGGASNRDYRLMLLRNAALGAAAATALLAASNGAQSVRAPSGGDVLPAVLIVTGGLLGLWMIRQVAEALSRRGPS